MTGALAGDTLCPSLQRDTKLHTIQSAEKDSIQNEIELCKNSRKDKIM